MNSVEYIIVSAEESGQKLLSFLSKRVKGVPLSALQKWIRKANVRVDKKRMTAYERVYEGQSVRIPPYDATEENKNTTEILPAAELLPVEILCEYENILVCYKPAGLAVQGGTGQKNSLADALKQQFSSALYKPAPAHRIDKETSGIVLAGKSFEAARYLAECFSKKDGLCKIYLAVVHGNWKEKEPVHLYDLLEEESKNGTRVTKDAHSLAVAIWAKKNSSLLAVRIFSGRTHQIRKQLSLRGFSLIGDTKYIQTVTEKKANIETELFQQGRMYLHAAYVEIKNKGFYAHSDWECMSEIAFISIKEKMQVLGAKYLDDCLELSKHKK